MNITNREQWLFLVGGGIILVIIIMVVVLNLIRFPPPSSAVVEVAQQTQLMVEAPAGAGWVDSKSPAPIFAEDGKGWETEGTSGAGSGNAATASWEQGGSAPGGSGSQTVTVEEIGGRQVVVPSGTSHAESPATTPEPPKATPKTITKPTTKPESKPAATVATKSEPKPTPSSRSTVEVAAPSPPASSVGGNYVVLLGSFTQQENADSIKKQISRLGIPVFQSDIMVGGARYIRIRGGPFLGREEATVAAGLIRSRTGIVGEVALNGK